MQQDNAREKIAKLLDEAIANLGYPVGMGMSPNPEWTDKLAAAILAARQLTK